MYETALTLSVADLGGSPGFRELPCMENGLFGYFQRNAQSFFN